MGTPDFAVPSLQFLLDAGYPIAGVVTAPDKTGGRGLKQKIISPVKKFAEAHQLTILQPVNLKSKKFLTQLKALKPDLQVVVAFRMLPEQVWNIPSLGTINLHGSLLPAYRGAAPIQWAIIKGGKMTGLTTFFLTHTIDTGNIICQLEIPILKNDTAGTLHDRMMQAGAGLLLGTVDLIVSGNAISIAQDESKISHAPKINHEISRIDWTADVENIYNLIRGMSPHPGAWSVIDNTEMKVFNARIYSDYRSNRPGTLRLFERKLLVQAGNGELEILDVQIAGKKRMSAEAFVNGMKIKDWLLT